jgi:thiol:disulfide interchange protein DsbC
MRKVLLSLSLVAGLLASDKLLPQKQVEKILKSSPVYSQVKSKLNKGLKVKGVDKGDFYIITVYGKQGEGNLFISKDLKYTILGNILDNKKKIPLRADYPVEPFKGNKEIVKNGIVFSFGKGKNDLYIVTDPQCPFCQRFEKLAEKSHLGDKYKIHIIFLPLSFHKHSKGMIYYILSANNDTEKAKRFRDTLKGGSEWKNFKPTEKQKKEIDKIINESTKAATELGARGTPSFYDKDMKLIKDRGSLFK